MASISPVMPVISGASRFQPVYVGDVADAVMAAIARPEAAGQTYELGGPRVATFRDLLSFVLAQVGRRRMIVEIPAKLANLQARFMEHLPGKPLTRDQLILLAKDNVTGDLPGLSALGIVATPMEQVVPGYLRRYRPGGGKREDAIA
jgi:NADH dehydrogenase